MPAKTCLVNETTKQYVILYDISAETRGLHMLNMETYYKWDLRNDTIYICLFSPLIESYERVYLQNVETGGRIEYELLQPFY